MAGNKTKLTDSSVEKFLKSVKDEQMQKDAFTILELMQKVTKSAPKMWGSTIIGFGEVRLKYESGRELDWFYMGFSPRKQNLVLYGNKQIPELMKKLGKHKTGKGCLYINKIEEIDLKVLEQIMKESLKEKKKS